LCDKCDKVEVATGMRLDAKGGMRSPTSPTAGLRPSPKPVRISEVVRKESNKIQRKNPLEKVTSYEIDNRMKSREKGETESNPLGHNN